MFDTPSRAARWVGVAVAALTLAAGLTACTGSSGGEEPGKKKGADKPLAVEFDLPEGFSENKDYEVQNPLADKYEVKAVSLDDVESLEVIVVVSYVIKSDTESMDRDELQGLVAGYVKKAGNEDTGPIYDSVANGHAGFHKYVRTPDESGDDIIRYDSDYFFQDNNLVQVICQKKHEDAKIQTGCETVLSSLEF